MCQEDFNIGRKFENKALIRLRNDDRKLVDIFNNREIVGRSI